MRRSTQILLVLMGGGVVGAAAIPLLRSPDCDPAIQVDGSCDTTNASSRTGSTGSSYSGTDSSTSRSSVGAAVTGAAAGAAAGAVAGAAVGSAARGGFGSTGSAHSSSSGG